MAWRQWGLVAASLLMLAGSGAAQPVREAAVQRPPAPGQPPSGPPEMKIAAVVNDEVISVYDLVSRIRLIMTSSNISDTPEARQKLASQVLRSLIDERLELEEAKREGVTATDAETTAALAQIEKQNNMQPGQLNTYLQARGIDRGSLVDQLTASIEWAKLVRRRAAETVEISDEEIDQATARLKEHAKDPESHVAEIFLSVDNPSQDAQVRATAERLTQEMKQGARFSAVARQFSQSATAAVGGDLGWVRPDELPAALRKEASELKVGELSPPIRTTGGYYLLLVLDRRNGSGPSEDSEVYDIVQVVFPLPPGSSMAVRRAVIGEAEAIRSAAKDCPTMLKIGKEKAPRLSSEGKLRENQISPMMRSLVNKLGVGQPSQPIVQRNGVGVIMICGKSNPTAGPVTRQQVAQQLLAQRLDMVAREYLHELRQNAYVDVRV